jgi:hypothetical protein
MRTAQFCPGPTADFLPAFLRRIRPALAGEFGPGHPLTRLAEECLQTSDAGATYTLLAALNGLPPKDKQKLLAGWPPDLHPTTDEAELVCWYVQQPVRRVLGVEVFESATSPGDVAFARASVGHVRRGSGAPVVIEVLERTPRQVALALLKAAVAEFEALWDEAMTDEGSRQDGVATARCP